ncbi:hypothetical protein M2101_001535 [Parabacteroides sp. PM5-20]|nr:MULTISPECIES: translocation/assembly module TamB domain-containing protein [unclassified Parabacteroides]MDH6534859.1 hypothetical protein [Parabacteroides sp. PM5-20]
MTQITTDELSEYLGVPVQIEHIGLKWFNRLVLEGVHLDDPTGEPLLEASHISAGFEFIPFLKGKLVFSTVRLFGFSLNLKKENPKADLNLQFLIDAFSQKDTLDKKTPNLDLRFNSILLRKGELRYNVTSERTSPGKFNAKHIHIDNLNANISLKAFNKDSLNAHIKKLSFDEASGFTLEKLSMNIVGSRDSASIDHFEIQLPQTKLKIDRATMNLSKVEGLTSFLNDAAVELSIAPSQIGLKDLAPFIPAFSHFTETVELSAEASGYINSIHLKRLTVQQKNQMQFNGRMELKGITQPGETYIFGQVNRMFITSEGLENLINNFNEQTRKLPEQLAHLGTINFSGEISGFFDNLVAFGELSSSIGNIQTDMIFGRNKEKNIDAYLKGHVSTSNLRINELFPQDTLFGNARFSLTLDAIRPVKGDFSGNIKGNIDEIDFKGYKYENILLAGNVQKSGFDGIIQMDDPNGKLQMEGMFKHEGANSVFNFTADVQHLRPDRLNLTDTYESPDISFSLKADFTGDNIDNLAGSIHLDSLSFQTLPNAFFLNKLEIAASGHHTDRRLTITSDILNGEVAGAYSFETILPSMVNTFEAYLPSLIKTTQKKKPTKENNFSVLFAIENTESLSNTLKLPFTIINQARITGHYNNRYDKFRLQAWLPQFKVGQSALESGYISIENPKEKVNLELAAVLYNDKGLRNRFNLKADAGQDQLNTFIQWANNKEQEFKADLSASALFIEEKTEGKKPTLRTEISIHQSPVVINDSLWNVEPASITIQKGKIDIDNFIVAHDEQYLHIDGAISPEVQDTLILDMQQIELSYIFETLAIPVLQFGGEATGTFVLNDLYHSRIMNTEEFVVQDFSFNQVDLGRLSLYSEWDDEQRGILLVGSIYKNDSTWTDVNGHIFPVKPNEGLSLHFDANDIDISFLHPFLNNVAKDIRGRGFGHVHLYGPFKELTAEGNAYVEDGGLGIDFLNTYYTFSDSVYLEPATIRLTDVSVYDKFGNKGKVSLAFNHTYFHDYDFRADIQATNLLVYDQSEKNSPMIYGTVFGSGTGSIVGNENVIDFDMNVRSGPKTSVGFNFMTSSASSEYDFITFIDKSQLSAHTDSLSTDSLKTRHLLPADSGAEIRMNFLVDVTPDATIELIMDPSAGDKIKGKASGSLQVQYGTKTDYRMYGGVNIVEGAYNFSLQQIIHKDFKIRDGSTINFQGDPYNAQMNVDAIYSLTANLSDLDEVIAKESDRTNVPVNCILKLDGMLRNPTISFDIELPNSNEELERQVRSFIDTEDVMSLQIVYLLVLNKFYTPEYSTNTYRTNDLNAVASSAISTQLTNLMNTFTDKVQIGTNIRTAQDWTKDDTEVEMLLSSQLLDNRLIFNGNFGYRNSQALEKNVFIGEFDLEYKLTPSGEIRLKAYNHANDMYHYLRQSLTTQGVGIMFKKDFTYLSDFFRRKKKIILTPPTPQKLTIDNP